VPLYNDLFGRLADSLTGTHTPFQERYADDPIGFAEEVLNVKLWEKQKEILRSLRDTKRTAASAAPATGKTFTAAVAALWFLNTHPYCKIPVTAAPPERQIRDILFAEIRLMQRRGLQRGVPLVGGEPNIMSIDVDDNWWIKGFTIPTSGTREERIAKFHGHHAPGGVFVIADEAHGIPPEVFEAIDNITSAANCRILLISNPLAPTGPFWQASRDRSFTTITISALEHPNVVQDAEIIPGAIDRETTQKRIKQWTRPADSIDTDGGEALIIDIPWMEGPRIVVNPIFCYKVLGTFPWEAASALIPMSWFSRARQNYEIVVEKARQSGYEIPPDLPPPIGGLDVAEQGTDNNALAFRYGSFLAPFIRWQGTDTTMTSYRAGRLAVELSSPRINIDGIGVGAGVAPGIRDRFSGLEAISVKVSWSPTKEAEEFQFHRLRDELGWGVREWFSQSDVAVPPDENFEADCFAFEYANTRSGIRISSKREVREKLMGRSPDAFDAFALTFFEGRKGGQIGRGVESMLMGRGGRGNNLRRLLGIR